MSTVATRLHVSRIEPAILLGQIHFFHDLGGNPIGYMTWAFIAEDTEQSLINE